jgi:cyclin-dependent kinase
VLAKSQAEEIQAFKEEEAGDGATIGSYKNCVLIASGVTSEVYKSKDRALKVIVETRNIEPHNPHRESKILENLKPRCIPLLETFRDQEQQFVLVFPYMPFTLADILDKGPIPEQQLRSYFKDLFSALSYIHSQGIIHRDIKPSAVLLESPDGPAWLSDFGAAWHPQLSRATEPSTAKILDIGTGPYRAPEVLFGHKEYGTAVDMWGAGCLLAECCRDPPKPLFESRATHEDGNQLGLILSIFKTLGTPTPETWPEALRFRTPPFDMYQVYEPRSWEEILPGIDPDYRELVAALVRYDGERATAEFALDNKCLVGVDLKAVLDADAEEDAEKGDEK